jgi:hypothetical protein
MRTAVLAALVVERRRRAFDRYLLNRALGAALRQVSSLRAAISPRNASMQSASEPCGRSATSPQEGHRGLGSDPRRPLRVAARRSSSARGSSRGGILEREWGAIGSLTGDVAAPGVSAACECGLYFFFVAPAATIESTRGAAGASQPSMASDPGRAAVANTCPQSWQRWAVTPSSAIASGRMSLEPQDGQSRAMLGRSEKAASIQLRYTVVKGPSIHIAWLYLDHLGKRGRDPFRVASANWKPSWRSGKVAGTRPTAAQGPG